MSSEGENVLANNTTKSHIPSKNVNSKLSIFRKTTTTDIYNETFEEITAPNGEKHVISTKSPDILINVDQINSINESRTISDKTEFQNNSISISFMEIDLEVMEEQQGHNNNGNPRFGLDSKIAFNPSIQSLFEGYALKLCPSFPLLWQRRYFIIRPEGMIYYFFNKQHFLLGETARGCIDMSDVRTDMFFFGVRVVNNKISIAVRSKNKRVYKIKVSSNDEASVWSKLIRSLISRVGRISSQGSGGNAYRELEGELVGYGTIGELCGDDHDKGVHML